MATNSKKLALVILAAGESRRMGRCKQTLPWKDTTLIGHVIEQALQSNADQVYVVLGARFREIEKETNKHQVQVVYNDSWKSGMGSSISLAIRRIQEDDKNINGVLIALSDQVLIETSYYNKLINKFLETKKIVVTQFRETTGVPVVFPKEFFGELCQLQGSRGAKSVIQRHRNLTTFISEDKAAVDLDTFEEYQSCFEEYGVS